MPVLFFDIGETLADASIGADGSLTLRPRPRVFDVLDASAGMRKGIISNPGTGEAARARAVAALHAAFAGRFTDDGLLHWGAKTSRGIFDSAVASAGVGADDCVFVGEDPDERAFAREAGMRAAAHPVFTFAAVEGRPVFWARIEVPADRSLADLEAIAHTGEVVPVHVASAHLVLVMATARGVAALEQGGFTADLRGEVAETTAFLMRDDRPVSLPEALTHVSGTAKETAEATLRAESAFTFIAGALDGPEQSVASLGPAPGGVYVAAAAGTPIEDLHIAEAKPGHTERLLPDPALLSRPGEAQVRGFADEFANGVPSPETVAAVRAAITPAAMRGHVARISGIAPLVEGDPLKVRSRDAASPDNALVVSALARRLHDLGLTVRRHEFSWRGRRLSNVEAEFPVAAADSAVLITAHLDSTAARGEFFDSSGRPRPYDPALDPAPGADDDGSGTAAVLATAECLSAMIAEGRAPTRTIRFVLFNAEEQGLVGSKAYARAAAAAGDRIVGVLQMDMIAGFQGGTRTMEIHTGSSVPGPVVGASDALGGLVAQAAPAVAADFSLQALAGSGDPAAGRSDHASFHERGWAAAAVCENFFDDTAPATGTRQYHMPGDTLLDEDHDTDYAAAIARTVAAAALTLAGL
ncbi:M28 family metallopeptidase [Streptomyces sp. Isolate_219]|uniref:M28 family metallopeptidase n=1 Tax=Streptomyces sp. Isolate_219 TaxID=2950110 RepID=UPI0021C8961C|nr:M28 family metallopeptidase [Streptomyces sp. Isolate_219]MCR8574775.1 M28 family metallopeptidase [Streptomyces sp. Isolate_219]